MNYAYLVKINNQHKKNLEDFIVNNVNYSKKVKNVFWDNDKVKRTNTYHLFCENKTIILRNEIEKDKSDYSVFTLDSINDLILFFKHREHCISNISFLSKFMNKFFKNYYLDNSDIDKILALKRKYDGINLFKVTKVDNLEKEISKVILCGGIVLYNNHNCFAIIKKGNDIYLWSEYNLIMSNNIPLFCDIDSKYIFIDNLDITSLTNLNHFFAECTAEKIILKNFNTRNVKIMNEMFGYCDNLKSVNIEDFDTSSLISATYMFLDCKCLLEVDLNNWKVNELINIEGMFSGCNSLENLMIDKWNTPNLRYMSYFIDDCNNLRKINLGFLKKADHIYVQQILNSIKKSNTGLKIEGL